METWWLGPVKILRRMGNMSYQVVHKPGEVWDVHREFLKPYVHDDFMGTTVPLYFHKGTTKDSGLSDPSDQVETIKGHRMKNNKLEFLVQWEHQPGEDSWEPATTFIQECSTKWLEYLKQTGLEANLSKLF